MKCFTLFQLHTHTLTQSHTSTQGAGTTIWRSLEVRCLAQGHLKGGGGGGNQTSNPAISEQPDLPPQATAAYQKSCGT